MSVQPSEEPFPWRSLAVSTFLPTVLFSIGEGAILPIIPVLAHHLGASLALAGFISALIMLGEMIGDIPSGVVVARLGEGRTMLVAAAISMAGTVVAFFAPNPTVLGIGVFVAGATSAAFALARHAFLTTVVPIEYRARALSTLGGTVRFGLLVGPFLTAGVVHLTGVTKYALLIHVAACLSAFVVLLVLPDPEKIFDVASRAEQPGGREPGETFVADEAHNLWRTLRENARVLGTIGTGAAILSALRQSRQVILPLWAVSIGLHASTSALVIGIAGAFDFALFYFGGSLMDRRGRLWVVLPTTAALAVCHLLLAGSAWLPNSVWIFAALAMFFAASNGLGSGILMTLGADHAPATHPAPFLGAWRFTNDTGGAVAPLLLSAVTALASLPIASVVVGVIGIGGVWVFKATLPGGPRPAEAD